MMSRHVLKLSCFLAVLLLFSSGEKELLAAPKWGSTCVSGLKSLVGLSDVSLKKSIAMGVVMAGGVLAGPNAYHEVNSRLESLDHIGYGIYLDVYKIEALLTPEERELLKDSKNNAKKIAQMFSNYLSGDFNYELESLSLIDNWFPRKTYASEYFVGQCDSRGVCRHKAHILSALLSHYGIENRVEVNAFAVNEPSQIHLWVYLTKLHLIVDPTAEPALIVSPEDYQLFLKLRGIPSERHPIDQTAHVLMSGTWY